MTHTYKYNSYLTKITHAASVDVLDRLTDGASVELDRREYAELLDAARPVRQQLVKSSRMF